MEYNIKDAEQVNAQGLFSTDDTVTIQLFNRERVDVTPLSPGEECVEIGTTGIFQWSYVNLDDLPTEYEEYTFIMTNQTGSKQRDVDVFSIYNPTVFLVPFEVKIESEESINKGDAWEPELRLDTNSPDLKVAIELTDGDTTINKYTANIDQGGDDQVKLLSEADTFQIFRLYLSGEETKSFESRFLDVKISAQTQSGKTQTTKMKVPFSEIPAISFDMV